MAYAKEGGLDRQVEPHPVAMAWKPVMKEDDVAFLMAGGVAASAPTGRGSKGGIGTSQSHGWREEDEEEGEGYFGTVLYSDGRRIPQDEDIVDVPREMLVCRANPAVQDWPGGRQ